MYNSFQLAAKYLKYYFNAYNGKGHGMHSPFVFDFVLNVLNNNKLYQAPLEVEQLRKELLRDNTVIEIEDLGAGSRLSKTKRKSISQLASVAVKPRKYSQLLYRLVRHYQPKTIIELGTSLGITTSYFTYANPSSLITTIEGSKSIADVALRNFNKLDQENINLIPGNFDDVLSTVLNNYETVDLAYIDGNHRYEPTIQYFNQFLKKVHNNSIIIFDDIHWSREMEDAWLTIKNHPQVQCSIDIFFLGFIFFKKEFKEKQHFSIRY